MGVAEADFAQTDDLPGGFRAGLTTPPEVSCG
jgi:hypothetical protein